jgi:SRSO17 transposase
VLVLDDTGDRKGDCTTDHVARQYLGSVGKIDNGIVAVTLLWAHAQRYYPLHVAPYTPEGRLPGGKQDPVFRTKPQIALALVEQAISAGIPFQAIVTDCAYGDNDALEIALRQRHLPYVLAHRGTVGHGWATATRSAGGLAN